MTRLRPAAATATALLALLPLSAFAADCNRACLSGLLKRYETQLLKHDARGLPFATGMRMTYNYQVVQPGESYWKDFDNVYNETLFVDPSAGQVAALGMARHGDRNAYFALRLKVVDRKITQSEMFIVHEGEASFFSKDTSKPIGATYSEVLPVSQRRRRETLVRIADAFTDSWQYRNEDLAPYDAKCQFFENNIEFTNDPNSPGIDDCGGMVEFGGKNGVPGTGKWGKANPNGVQRTGPDPARPGRAVSWREADPSIGRPKLLGSQMWMRDRRYPIVDVERGVVFFYQIQGGSNPRPGEKIVYERAAPMAGATGAGGPPPQGDGAPPPGGGGAAYMVALIKVVDGKIVRIDHFEREGGPNAIGGFAD